MSKETNRKVIDTTPQQCPAFVRVHTYNPARGEETKLVLQRYLLTKIETTINRDEALAIVQALVEHFEIMPKEVATAVLAAQMPKSEELPAIHFIIVYGPKGCGKTRNRDAIQKHYNAHKVLDMDSIYVGYDLSILRRGISDNSRVVLLTSLEGEELYKMRRKLGVEGIHAIQYSYAEFVHARQKTCEHDWHRIFTPDTRQEEHFLCTKCGAQK